MQPVSGTFLHCIYRVQFPLNPDRTSLVGRWKPIYTRYGAPFRFGVVSSVKKQPKYLKKFSIHIKQPIQNYQTIQIFIKKKKNKHIQNISQIPTQNISNKFTIFLKSIVRQSIVSILGLEHQIYSHTKQQGEAQ